jgi:release factor glutamine methyltransferase
VARYRRATSCYAAGAPFQSAVGLAAFRTVQLAVNRDVLIPRVETEDLVTHVLAWAAEHSVGHSWGVAADIGTGTGAIAISLAVEGEFERVIATDISSSALDVARRNVAAAVGTRTPVELRPGSLLEPLSETVDVIVSNPPYLTSAECDLLAPEVRDYEPRLALDGGSDGLDPYRILVSGAARRLATGGLLALEIDSRRPDAILAMATAAGWSDARIVNDVFGRARYLLATNGKRTQ